MSPKRTRALPRGAVINARRGGAIGDRPQREQDRRPSRLVLAHGKQALRPACGDEQVRRDALFGTCIRARASLGVRHDFVSALGRYRSRSDGPSAMAGLLVERRTSCLTDRSVGRSVRLSVVS